MGVESVEELSAVQSDLACYIIVVLKPFDLLNEIGLVILHGDVVDKWDPVVAVKWLKS